MSATQSKLPSHDRDLEEAADAKAGVDSYLSSSQVIASMTWPDSDGVMLPFLIQFLHTPLPI